MGAFERIFGKEGNRLEKINLDVELEGCDLTEEPVDHYVIRIDVESEGSMKAVIAALDEKKIVVSNLAVLSKRPKKLKEVLDYLKAYVHKKGGAIGALDNELIIVTPARVGIRKRKR